jgi:hypothetical protein
LFLLQPRPFEHRCQGDFVLASWLRDEGFGCGVVPGAGESSGPEAISVYKAAVTAFTWV